MYKPCIKLVQIVIGAVDDLAVLVRQRAHVTPTFVATRLPGTVVPGLAGDRGYGTGMEQVWNRYGTRWKYNANLKFRNVAPAVPITTFTKLTQGLHKAYTRLVQSLYKDYIKLIYYSIVTVMI